MLQSISNNQTLNSSTILSALEALRDEERKNFSFYKPHPKQLEFHKLGKVAKDRAFFAANRSGKTEAGCTETAMHITGYYADWWEGYCYNRAVNVWIGCISAKEVRDLEMRFFEGDSKHLPWIHESLVLYANRTEHFYMILHKSGTISHVRFKTYGEGQRGWQASTVDIILLDEEPTFEIMSEASMRLMSTSADHYGMMIITATCLYQTEFVVSFTERVIDVKTEEYGQIVDKKEQIKIAPGEIINSKVYINAGWEDAPHLTEEEKQRLLEKIPLHERQARTTGVPSVGSGMVYPIMQQTITCDPFEIPDDYYICAGMDFGWKNPTAVVFLATNKKTNKTYVFAEYKQNERTPEDHKHLMTKMRIISDLVQRTPYACDPTGDNASQIDGRRLTELYKKTGMNMHLADNAVHAGTQAVLQMLQNGELIIFSTCTMLLSEMRSYSYDEKGNVKKGNDHLLDAWRYGITTGLQKAISKHLIIKPANNNYELYGNNRSTGGGYI